MIRFNVTMICLPSSSLAALLQSCRLRPSLRLFQEPFLDFGSRQHKYSLPGLLIFLMALGAALALGADDTPSSQPTTVPANAFHGFTEIFDTMPEELLPEPGQDLWSPAKRDAAEKWFDASINGRAIVGEGEIIKFGMPTTLHVYLNIPRVKRRGMEISKVEYWINVSKEVSDSFSNHQVINFTGIIDFARIQARGSSSPDRKFERSGFLRVSHFALLKKGEIKTYPPTTAPVRPQTPISSMELINSIPDEMLPDVGMTEWPEELLAQVWKWNDDHFGEMPIQLTGRFSKTAGGIGTGGPSVSINYQWRRKGIVLHSVSASLFNEKDNHFPFAEGQTIRVTGVIRLLYIGQYHLPRGQPNVPKDLIPVQIQMMLIDAKATAVPDSTTRPRQ
jgi:hypothetical protein